jgi:uncharacterized membrane protein
VSKRLADGCSGFLVALMFAIGFWAIDALPAGAWVPVHWAADMQPDGWTGKWMGMLAMPLAATFLCCAQTAFMQTAPTPGRLELTDGARRTIVVGVLAVQAVVQSAIALLVVH